MRTTGRSHGSLHMPVLHRILAATSTLDSTSSSCLSSPRWRDGNIRCAWLTSNVIVLECSSTKECTPFRLHASRHGTRMRVIRRGRPSILRHTMPWLVSTLYIEIIVLHKSWIDIDSIQFSSGREKKRAQRKTKNSFRKQNGWNDLLISDITKQIMFNNDWLTPPRLSPPGSRQKPPARLSISLKMSIITSALLRNNFQIETHRPESVVARYHRTHRILHPAVEEVAFSCG